MNPFPGLPLCTPRLELRRLTLQDRERLFEIFSHREVMRFWSSPSWSDAAQAEKMIAAAQTAYESGEHLRLGIARAADQALIGMCTLFAIDRQCRRAEIGYALGRPFWGQGYMAEALGRLVRYAFEDLALNRLEADVDPRNLASIRTVLRLGFVKEGYMRQRWIVGTEVSDTEFYGLLRCDWDELTRTASSESPGPYS